MKNFSGMELNRSTVWPNIWQNSSARAAPGSSRAHSKRHSGV